MLHAHQMKINLLYMEEQQGVSYIKIIFIKYYFLIFINIAGGLASDELFLLDLKMGTTKPNG